MYVVCLYVLTMGIFCVCRHVDCYQKVYFDQIKQRRIDLTRNEAILLKSSNQTKHLKNGVNATIVFNAETPGDRIVIQTHTFATNCSRIHFYIYDGPVIDKRTSLNGPHGTCGAYIDYQTYQSSSSAMTLNFVTSQVGGDPAGGFNWTVLAYHTAPCDKDEWECARGRCYPNQLLCDELINCSDVGFSFSCSRHHEESVSAGVDVAVIVAVVVVVVVVVVAITVTVIYLVRRKRLSYRSLDG